MFHTRWCKMLVITIAFLFVSIFVVEFDAYARVGGGISSGSRGSRSYSAPSRPSSPGPSSSYSSPTGPTQQPNQPIGQQPRSGLWTGLAGGLAGGLLGGMLFRSLAFGGGAGGMGGGGIGMFEILLIAFILFGIYWFIKRRRRAAQEAAGSNSYQQSSTGAPDAFTREPFSPTYGSQPDYNPQPGQSPQSARADTDAGLGHIRQMDPAFEERRFLDLAGDQFFKIQGAWGSRDLSAVRPLLTEEMYATIQRDADRLKADKRINKLDNIAVRTVDIGEAWQESGQDYITVRFYANLLDYTVDEATGDVVLGSKTEPVKFEEYWTFTRPVGNNPWRLSAITQPS